MTTHRPTPHEAETAGLVAGMTTGASRIVPPEYASNERLSRAWLEAFDSMAQSLRGLVIDTKKRKAPKKIDATESKPVVVQAQEKASPPVTQGPRPMMPILNSRYVDAV